MKAVDGQVWEVCIGNPECGEWNAIRARILLEAAEFLRAWPRGTFPSDTRGPWEFAYRRAADELASLATGEPL